MKFISLIDTITQIVITIDASCLLLRLEIDGALRQTRIKPYMASVLYELFNKHPTPLCYEQIIKILKNHNLVISDFTRMHRKLSEIRQFLHKVHPNLADLVLNTRGLGYSLPLRLKNLHRIGNKQVNLEFANKKITKSIQILEGLINQSINMTAQNKVIKYFQGYVIHRDPVKPILIEAISTFNECQKTILQEIRVHEAEFIGIRINYLLVKLKTYVGLARISEYPISEEQWLDWFKQEVWMLFDELKKQIRFAESDIAPL
ncbi:MAG: hypothetical protein JWM09_5 [Francisellaceae bacterium]|nr:hypothetical protein [Francisellaceae bacterium]